MDIALLDPARELHMPGLVAPMAFFLAELRYFLFHSVDRNVAAVDIP
jgi:hypothetical protein